jgi:hypothetical protein
MPRPDAIRLRLTNLDLNITRAGIVYSLRDRGAAASTAGDQGCDGGSSLRGAVAQQCGRFRHGRSSRQFRWSDISTSLLAGKQFGLLHEVVPKAAVFGVLVNPDAPMLRSNMPPINLFCGPPAHATKWTLVVDPPRKARRLTLFDTQAEVHAESSASASAG